MAIDTKVTLKRLIAEFSEWATAHPMVNDFGYGQYLETYRSSDNKYLALIVNSPTLTSEDFFVNYQWEVICLDYVLDEKENMQRVLSDTQDVLRDLENTVRYSRRWKEFSRAEGQWSYRKVDEFGADKCFGWIATFTLKIKKKHGICDITSLMPTYDFETGPVVYPTCDPVTLSLDTDVIASITSGDSYNITLEDADGNPVVWIYDAPTKTLTIQLGTCDPVTFTFNGDTITPTPSGEAKAILFKNSAGTNLGVVTTDTANTFKATASDITKTDSDGTVTSVPAGVNVVCTPASGGVEQIGYVVNDDFSTVANLDNYDLVSTGDVAYNLNSGYLKVSGTPASISPITTFAKYKHSIALEKYGLRFRVIPKTSTPGANESVVWGIEADIVSGMPPGYIRKELFYWYRNPSAPTITGKIYRSINNGTGAQFVTTAVAPIVDHEYEILMFLMFNQLMVTIKDITPGFENEQGETVAFTYANTTGQLTPRSSRLFIGTGGGEHWFSNFQIISTDLKAGKHIVVHDSLGDGYCTDYFVQRWLDIHKANNPDLVIMKSGRQGDWPSGAVLRMDEFAILKGANTTVHLHIGTNQVITSGPGPAFTSYQQLINGLIALGYTTFVHYYAFPRGGSTAINTYNASILSTYGALAGHTVVDTNTPFNNGANSLLPQYAATDNVHLNAGAGQRKMAELTAPYFV